MSYADNKGVSQYNTFSVDLMGKKNIYICLSLWNGLFINTF